MISVSVHSVARENLMPPPLHNVGLEKIEPRKKVSENLFNVGLEKMGSRKR